MNTLTSVQEAVANRVLEEEERTRKHIVVSLSGAHAYGFPSPDSDLDLKAIHIEPTRRLLGLAPLRPVPSRLETIEGVEIDYSSNEIGQALAGMLAGNGNYIERVLGAIPLRAAPQLNSLRLVARRALSRRVHRHYHGFATGQLREFEAADPAPAKRMLYVLRTTLTGTHLLRTGEVVTDVTQLLEPYGFAEAHELVHTKRAGERVPLSASAKEHWLAEIQRAFTVLDDAFRDSVLPEEPTNWGEMDSWLVELRTSLL
jgi:predicted nucleotidyltransferase